MLMACHNVSNDEGIHGIHGRERVALTQPKVTVLIKTLHFKVMWHK